MRQAHPGQPLEVWAQDEHRVGLKPIVRWVWARRGQRIVAAVHPRYVWTYLYAFVRRNWSGGLAEQCSIEA